MSPPTALLLTDGISPNEEVISELDCTSIISVARSFPPPTIRNLLAANRKYNCKHCSERLLGMTSLKMLFKLVGI